MTNCHIAEWYVYHLAPSCFASILADRSRNFEPTVDDSGALLAVEVTE